MAVKVGLFLENSDAPLTRRFVEAILAQANCEVRNRALDVRVVVTDSLTVARRMISNFKLVVVVFSAREDGAQAIRYFARHHGGRVFAAPIGSGPNRSLAEDLAEAILDVEASRWRL